MSAMTRWERKPLMDLLDWAESPMTMFRPFSAQAIRTETFVKDSKFVVRAELPGLDPERDVDVSVADGVLTIHAERKEEKVDKTHSEFRYGEFTRHAALPEGADESSVSASYDKGILEVVASMKRPGSQKQERKVPVKASGTKKSSR
jgi:HSP20 family protein